MTRYYVFKGWGAYTTPYPELWLLVLGGLFVAVVLFFPDGVVGTAQKLVRSSRAPHGAFDRSTTRSDEGRRPEEAKPQAELPHVHAR